MRKRLLSLGKDSFPPGTDRRTIENQLIGFFIDGLCQDSLKMKLMRDNPDNFQNAVRIALQEQNLRKRFNSRTSNQSNYHNQHMSHEPMEVDHIRPRARRDNRYMRDRNRHHINEVTENQSHRNESQRHRNQRLMCLLRKTFM